ncbi:MAG: serine/threonine protein kinase, partial [Myxococcales bacterium]|nr:serine/threonine protein kinase [Myxococcales bacterium]
MTNIGQSAEPGPGPLPQPPCQFGDYILLTELARGGMAEVYLGQQVTNALTDDFLAVKLLLPKLAKRRKFVDMFTSEGTLGLMLNHPNVVRTYDVGRVRYTRFIAMEFIEGQDLGKIVRFFRKAAAPIPLEAALYIVHEVLEGLQYAHDLEDESGQPLHLVNRDVSPANIMIGYDGQVKIIDFGIAQALLDYRSQIGSIKGKVTYMSPEQVRGLALDARSDLFSLGTVLYQLLTMHEPFHAPTEFEQMELVRQATPDSPKR